MERLKKFLNKFLSIDPSGSGETGIFFYDHEKKIFEFFSFKFSTDWKEHFKFINDKCIEKNIKFVIYESTNFLKTKGKDLTSLIKVFGSIETISIINSDIKCFDVPVRDVKRTYKKILNSEEKIKNLSLKRGRGGGWLWNNNKINIHQLDSLIIFYLYSKKFENEIFKELFF